jgi:hypothetical protein
MPEPGPSAGRRMRWRDVYREAELYKAVVRVYTKPLFSWRKALATSTDGRTLYDLAGAGLRSLGRLDRELRREEFRFRSAVALRYNFNGKHRTLYVSPWEERIVDLLLYRVLNRRLHRWFSTNSYAYRDRTFGLDGCQARIARVLRRADGPLYIIKRDITDYFASVNHDLLIAQLEVLVERDDYLFTLLEQRVRFRYRDETDEHTAEQGIPFGAAVACLLANVYLAALDRAIERNPRVEYFRYADDLLILSSDRGAALAAREQLERTLAELRLSTKPSHQADLALSVQPVADPVFAPAQNFRHLGLLFRAGGGVSLSRDKSRKIQNLFRYAFRRSRRRWRKIAGPEERAQAVVQVAAETAEKGVRNVAILDYYLRHVDDQAQLVRLDRWLAEEILSQVFGGHKKGHFRKIAFARLRSMGLPSLVHRRRLILNGRIASPFFIWQQQRAARAFRGTVARPLSSGSSTAFSPLPEAAAP